MFLIPVTGCYRASCRYFDVPMEILPKVRSSSEIYGWMVSSDNLHCLFYNPVCVVRWT